MLDKLIKGFLTKSWEYRVFKRMRRKIKPLSARIAKLYPTQRYSRLKEHQNLWSPLHKKVNPSWYKMMSAMRQEEDPRYLGEDIYLACIEPCLNNKAYTLPLSDKNTYEKTPYGDLFPKAVLHVMDGVCYDPDYNRITYTQAEQLLKKQQILVVKTAVESGGGRGVELFDKNNPIPDLKQLIKSFSRNLIVQQIMQQYEWAAQFNPTSINTIRLVTYRSVKTNDIHILFTVIRIGKTNSRVDNYSSGGIFCGIDADGNVTEWGTDKQCTKVYQNGDFVFKTAKPMPFIKEIRSIAKQIASQYYYLRLLGFDFFVDADGKIRLLEINNVHMDINFQICTGPMFKDLTQEVIEFCSKNPRSFCFDYWM